MASSDAAFENCPFFETPFRTFKEERKKKTEKEETSKRHDTAIFLKETSSFHPCPSNPIQENDNNKKKRRKESSGVLTLRDSSEIWKFSGTLGVTEGRREDASCSLSTQTPPLPPGTEQGEEK
ncbi:hypothetical protein TNCV_3324531 [Trichonephila clavipes]|nr:hypothetical protein TNCV_3324531 [Trichonephila clavipes]